MGTLAAAAASDQTSWPDAAIVITIILVAGYLFGKFLGR